MSLLLLAGCNTAPAPDPSAPVSLGVWMGEDGSCSFSLDGDRLSGAELKRRIEDLGDRKVEVRAGDSDTPFICIGNAISVLKQAGAKFEFRAPPSSIAGPPAVVPDR